MGRTVATNTDVDLESLLEFVRPRHQMIITTWKADGGTEFAGRRGRRLRRPDRHRHVPGAGEDPQPAKGAVGIRPRPVR